MNLLNLPPRLIDKIECEPNTGCWLWLAGRNNKGYGVVWHAGKTVLVHRFAYVLLNGEISEGLTIDHLCRNRACCNPAHLEVVDSRTNTLRGEGLTAKKARQTHCKHGHPLTGANLLKSPLGRPTVRHCRACKQARDRRRYRKRDREHDASRQRKEVTCDLVN